MLLGILIGAVRRYFRYHELAIHIGQLDDRTLSDIGCTRSQLYAEAWDRADHGTRHEPRPLFITRKKARGTTRASARSYDDRA